MGIVGSRPPSILLGPSTLYRLPRHPLPSRWPCAHGVVWTERNSPVPIPSPTKSKTVGGVGICCHSAIRSQRIESDIHKQSCIPFKTLFDDWPRGFLRVPLCSWLTVLWTALCIEETENLSWIIIGFSDFLLVSVMTHLDFR